MIEQVHQLATVQSTNVSSTQELRKDGTNSVNRLYRFWVSIGNVQVRTPRCHSAPSLCAYRSDSYDTACIQWFLKGRSQRSHYSRTIIWKISFLVCVYIKVWRHFKMAIIFCWHVAIVVSAWQTSFLMISKVCRN